MSALVIIGIAVVAALGSRPERGGSTPIWPFVVVVVLGLTMAVIIPVVGYRAAPLAPDMDDTESRRQGVDISDS